MRFLRTFLSNHVLANVTFAVVLMIGILAYAQMPRAKDPEVNFNWISIITAFPGASATDVEKLITDPLEDAIAQVSDVKFVSSNSREGISDILVRFEDIDDRTFDKRLNDLRREIQNKTNQELPTETEDPMVLEVTTANSFPMATLVVVGESDDEVLRRVAERIKQDLERMPGVDGVQPAGLRDPELQVDFDPRKLRDFGVTPTQLANSLNAFFRDISAGNLQLGNRQWLVRFIGTDSNPGYLARLPILTAKGEVPVASMAEVSRGRATPRKLVRYNGRPGVMFGITKKAHVNTLDLVERINEYLAQKNPLTAQFGIKTVLLDDQTAPTREALDVMQSNALLGLLLVFVVTFIFLGWHIAFFIGIGIPFTLAGTFLVLSASGQTLNQSVLLGVVIVLGMLVDDAVVVVESIYYRVQRGVQAMRATLEALREVFAPVTSSVLTTIAAFLPLMLLPGIVGKFMFVIPFVVTVALVMSLLEAYWMLPVHVSAARVRFDEPSRIHALRVRFTRWLRLKYSRMLVTVLRRPGVSIGAVLLLFVAAMGAFAAGMVRVQFFAFDPMRLFYVNVEMEPGASLEDTLRKTVAVEEKVKRHLQPGELREISSAAGQMFTETAPFFGDQYGQVLVSLHPRASGMRSVEQIIDEMRTDVLHTVGPVNTAFLKVSSGPPATKPISIKARGDDLEELRGAADALRGILTAMPAVTDITDDDSPGKEELRLRLDTDAVKRAGLDPADLARTVRLLFDGEVVASMQYEGDKLDVRVRAKPAVVQDVRTVLHQPMALPDGGEISLRELMPYETGVGRANIRHYDLRRAITVEADLDKEAMDTVAANTHIKDAWAKIHYRFPNVDLDFSGELDDIQESLDAMLMLFLFGVGLIYLILGAQFKSYFQPLMILSTVPMAFIGVTLGLIVTRNPLSLYTLYGVIALAGIAVNSAIVLIDAANDRLARGMSIQHATVYAARRRVIPILITSLTTIAGLLSLATGLGGESLLWGPVASAIVWGLAFSTFLTLFVIPLLYRVFMARRARKRTTRLTEVPI